MLGLFKMLARVLVLGGIAAAHVPADKAHAQAHPFIANLYAVLAYSYIRGMHILNLILMGALLIHKPIVPK
jgi:hypothetical protein